MSIEPLAEGTIETIEEALQDMGERLPTLDEQARAAVSSGDSFEVVVRVQPGKQGVAVAMRSTLTSSKVSHGRLIRLK